MQRGSDANLNLEEKRRSLDEYTPIYEQSSNPNLKIISEPYADGKRVRRPKGHERAPVTTGLGATAAGGSEDLINMDSWDPQSGETIDTVPIGINRTSGAGDYVSGLKSVY